MKLNATTEMIPITWPEFGAIHPFARWTRRRAIDNCWSSLSAWLAEITGFEAISAAAERRQPGRVRGAADHPEVSRRARRGHRKICLIPASAHGTNPASAHLAGLEVVVVGCDTSGNVDLDDLRVKAARTARICGPDDHLSLDPWRL